MWKHLLGVWGALSQLSPWTELCGSVWGSSASRQSWGRWCRKRGAGRSGCTSQFWGSHARGPWQPAGWSWTPSAAARCHQWASGTAHQCPRKAGNPHPSKSPLGFEQQDGEQTRETTNTRIIGKRHFYFKLIIWRLLIYRLNVITQRKYSYQIIGLLFAVGFFFFLNCTIKEPPEHWGWINLFMKQQFTKLPKIPARTI